MDFSALLGPAAAWFDAHPAGVAWFTGWFAALSAGQAVKQALPPDWSTSRVKRLVQLVAMLTGGAIAFVLWPRDPEHAAHAVAESLVCGLSAPTVYTFLKAVIEARFPRLAYFLSWQRVQDRNAPPAPPEGAQ